MEAKEKIYCLAPVYNDWESLAILVSEISKLEAEFPKFAFSFIAVNDGSTEAHFFETMLPYTQVNLKINVGHQRAIAIGLQYVFNELPDFDYLVVLDSDGEDKPQDIPALIAKAKAQQNKKIIFAQRRKRQESALFQTGYFFYKYLFYFLTGQKINFGNFSVIPRKMLEKVVYLNNIWNHYSGGILQSKLPYDKVLLDRGARYKGKSKMNMNSLILHGLSSISVYFDFLSLRILKVTLYGIVVCVFSVVYILYQKLFTEDAIPGWASSLILIISGIVMQLFSVTLIVLLMQLRARKNIHAPNSKIYEDFVKDIQ